MTYCCEDCGFLFKRVGEVEACPMCEKHRLRYATQEESEKLQSILSNKNKQGENK